MADEDDATDILGVPDAAYFDPSIPGRGAAKTGPGRIQGFQTGYAGGWTTERPQRPQIDIVEMAFGSGPAWAAPVPETAGQGRTGRAQRHRQDDGQRHPGGGACWPLNRRRKPWLNELAMTYDFSLLPNPRTDERLLLGVADDPARQDQPTVFYEPDKDGNMAIYGTGGSGKSAALRGIAIAAAVTPRGGPVQVYGIDCGSAGLKMLEELPHVGGIIDGDDVERVGRLLRWLQRASPRTGPPVSPRSGPPRSWSTASSPACPMKSASSCWSTACRPSARPMNTASFPASGTSSCSWPPTGVPWASTSSSPVTAPTPCRRRCLPPSSGGWCSGCPPRTTT